MLSLICVCVILCIYFFVYVLYFSCSVHLCTFQLVFRTFFCIFFTISIYFTGFWLLLYFLAGIPGLPRLVWELTFSESDTTRILNILSANFAPPFQFHFSFFSFSLSTFHKDDPIQFYGNITTLIFGNNFGHGKSWANMIQ